METIEQLVNNLNIGDWEEEVFRWVCEQAQAVTRLLLEKVDKALMDNREVGLEVVGMRERRVVTRFGDVVIKRRMYCDGQGRSRFLLDEALGLDKRSPVSPGVKEICILLASYLPFGKCEKVLQLLLPRGVSHTTVHRLLGRTTDPQLAEETKELRQVFCNGKMPKVGERQVPHLLVEADGVSIALQREKERRTEVKVGIAYEGWQETGSRGRYRTSEKTVYLGVMDESRFWEGFSLTLAKKYDLAKVGEIVVGGDGAGWIREGVELLGGTYQLDRFHLRRALLRGLSGDIGVANEVYRACVTGNVALADSLLLKEQAQEGGDKAIELARLRGYIMDNACGLADYRTKVRGEGLRGLGAIEGNIDKLAASRMKKRGMSWTKRGAQRMARLIQMIFDGESKTWIKPAMPVKTKVAIKSKMSIHVKGRHRCQDSTWLDVNLPALYGPHCNRPWVRALRLIAHGMGDR